jgi:hypothetical protein
MGCHTWLYKKIETPSYEHIQKSVIHWYKKNINEMRNMYKQFDEGTLSDSDKECFENCNFGKYREKWINMCLIWERQMRMVENGLCKVATCKKYAENQEGLVTYIDGKGFYKSIKYGDIFRRYDYPVDKLWSYFETMEYVNNPANECVLYDTSYKCIKEFWDKHPDGMIDFG